MKLSAAAAVAALGAAVSGCATVIEGTTQSVSVNTTPVTGAACTLTNSQGTWYVSSPGSVVVHKTKTDLGVTCQKGGYEPGHVVAISHFGATTAANVLGGVGGVVVGGVVDAASGANYSYDNPITVPLGAAIAGVVAGNEPPSPYPVSLNCANPAVTGTLVPDGPDGYLTATVDFDINSTATPGAVHVTPQRDGICTLSTLQGFAVSSASFSIASSSMNDGEPVANHVDISETTPGESHAPGYSFTVKAKDTTRGSVTVKFPISYR
ncbi:MAG TPA: hypothetical protein VHW69_06965 [Rhizomicrobium sp.]|jgi:hypothetical protein|nr:hypothetical protein [Rhizomicrobium sp.]